MSKRKASSQRISRLLREHVAGADITVGEIAKRARWSYLRTLRLLNGDTELSAADMEVFARILERDVGDLYKAPPAEARAS